jgi:hypothetical protein
MDTELLVEQIDAGQDLIEQLARDGFEVSVAFWVKTSDDGVWYLTIASPSVDPKQPGAAYHKLFTSTDKVESSWVSPAFAKLLNDQDPIARAAIKVRERHPGTRYQGSRLGTLEIKEAYIYPETSLLRLAFTVIYARNGTTNHWTATVRRGPLYRDMKAKGAVSHSTALYAGETEEDQNFANVAVLVAIDPKFDRPDILDNPEMRRVWADQARIMADEMFKSRHPDAVIEHEASREQIHFS